MDRIICDICGSEYPGSADVCPVCGYPRQGNEKAAAAAGETVRAKVKGGRFSSKNVRKRQKALRRKSREPETEPSNRGLWITIILLLIAIALVSAYILFRFWGGWDDFTGGIQTTTSQPTVTTAPVETTIPCVSVTVNVTMVELEEVGQQAVVVVSKAPQNTTDPVRFVSEDPAVAQVSEEGIITAMGPGQTRIIITCGSARTECAVVCWFQEQTTAPQETTTPVETTVPEQTTVATQPAELRLDHTDVSLFQAGERFTIKVMLGDSYISRSSVEWTSSDPNVASVENGVVTAVGPGVATITAKYQGQKQVCIVRCQFRDITWRATATDVTLSVGESFRLSVVNNSGEKADVLWSLDREGIVSEKNGTVTALSRGTVTLYTTVDGVKIWCVVRVK